MTLLNAALKPIVWLKTSIKDGLKHKNWKIFITEKKQSKKTVGKSTFKHSLHCMTIGVISTSK